jgi:O-antigen/teichoic acid export membrane protein
MSELEDAAAYKAIQNLAMPFGQILTVFTMMMLPVMSRVVKSDSQNRINKYIWGLTLGFGFGAFVYGMVLVLFGKQILLFLYNNMFYADYCWLIPVFALVLVIRAINQSLATIIRAYENTKTILAAKISTAVVVLFVLMIFVPIMNMHGVLLAMILGVLTEFCIVVRFFLRRKQKDGNNEVLR